jgi:hypothetical protein
MEMDPHTLQMIIRRIEQQMRCPQCGKRVPVDFASVRVATDKFMLLQLRCDTCDAYIVLHASLQGAENAAREELGGDMTNVSSSLQLHEDELSCLRQALEQNGGSFEKLFKSVQQTDQGDGTAIV